MLFILFHLASSFHFKPTPTTSSECRIELSANNEMQFYQSSKVNCKLYRFNTPLLRDRDCEGVALVKVASSISYAFQHNESLINIARYAEAAGGMTPYIYIGNVTGELAKADYGNHYIKIDAVNTTMLQQCHKWVFYTDMDMWYSEKGFQRMRVDKSTLDQLVPQTAHFIGGAERYYCAGVFILRNSHVSRIILQAWQDTALQNKLYNIRDQPSLIATMNRILDGKNGRSIQQSTPNHNFDQRFQPLGTLQDEGRVQALTDYDWSPFWFWPQFSNAHPPLHKCPWPGCSSRDESIVYHFGHTRYTTEIQSIPLKFTLDAQLPEFER